MVYLELVSLELSLLAYLSWTGILGGGKAIVHTLAVLKLFPISLLLLEHVGAWSLDINNKTGRINTPILLLHFKTSVLRRGWETGSYFKEKEDIHQISRSWEADSLIKKKRIYLP